MNFTYILAERKRIAYKYSKEPEDLNQYDIFQTYIYVTKSNTKIISKLNDIIDPEIKWEFFNESPMVLSNLNIEKFIWLDDSKQEGLIFNSDQVKNFLDQLGSFAVEKIYRSIIKDGKSYRNEHAYFCKWDK
jgi:hypothetical protein